MKTKLLLLALMVGLFSTTALAQKKPVDSTKKIEKKIIIKKGKKADGSSSDQKITVEVDGDKVLINGKPAEDFKGEDIQIMNGDDIESFSWSMPEGVHNGKAFYFNEAPTEMKMNKAVLGVSTEKVEEGAKVMEVSKESAAEKAGIKVDDIITKLNDEKILGPKELYEVVGKYNPNDKVKLTFLRDGAEKTTEIVLGKNKMQKKITVHGMPNMPDNIEMPEMPRVEAFMNKFVPRPKVGFQVQDVEEGDGVKIIDVKPETPAAKAGFQKDDIILEMDGQVVKNVDDIKDKMADLKEGETMKIKYKRNNKTTTTEMKLPKKLKTANL